MPALLALRPLALELHGLPPDARNFAARGARRARSEDARHAGKAAQRGGRRLGSDISFTNKAK